MVTVLDGSLDMRTPEGRKVFIVWVVFMAWMLAFSAIIPATAGFGKLVFGPWAMARGVVLIDLVSPEELESGVNHERAYFRGTQHRGAPSKASDAVEMLVAVATANGPVLVVVPEAEYQGSVLLEQRHLPGTPFAKPSFVSQVPLDFLWDGTQEEYVTWGFGIWQDLVLETAESPFGTSFTTLIWWEDGLAKSLEMPVGNYVRLVSCEKETFIRFRENGYPVYLDAVPGKGKVFSLSISYCMGKQNVVVAEETANLPATIEVGELVSQTSLIWIHLHFSTKMESKELDLGDEVLIQGIPGVSGVGLSDDQKIYTMSEDGGWNLLHTNGTGFFQLAPGLFVQNNYDGTATLFWTPGMWSPS